MNHDHGRASWGMAAGATLHCLTGCAIGEVLGMVIGTALGWGNLPTTVLAIALAFLFGYAFTLRGILSAGVDARTAVRVALAADTLSIAVMELIDNGVILLWPGAMDSRPLGAAVLDRAGGLARDRLRRDDPGQQVDDRPRQGPRGRPPVPLT